MNPKKKIGIALSGGSIRGFAHLGVLQALAEHKVKPDVISGTSAGAIMGAFIGAGYTPKTTLKLLSHPPYRKSLHWWPTGGGFVDLKMIGQMIKDHIQPDDFKSLKKPLYVTATNLTTGEPETFDSGVLSSAIMASSAIPLFFKPVRRNGFTYVDGGLLNNLPVEPLFETKCDLSIAINVNASYYGVSDNLSNIKNVGTRCFHVLIKENTERRMQMANVVFSISSLSEYTMFDFKDAAKIFDIGYKSACEEIDNGLLEGWI